MSPPHLIDSHAHLDYEELAGNLAGVLGRAEDAGVVGVVAIGTDLASSVRTLELARAHPQLAATAGIHPHEASKATTEDWAALGPLYADPRVVAVGEVGLDYHYDFSPRDVQRDLFRRQLQRAASVDLPLVIHVREAYDDAFELIQHEGLPAGGVLHCFSGGPRECERALELGLYVSLSGIVTFPRALEVQQAAVLVPADRLLLETDAPYLAPVPRRGKTNEPALVAFTARRVAELRGVELELLARQTRSNTVRLFRLHGVLPRHATADTVEP